MKPKLTSSIAMLFLGGLSLHAAAFLSYQYTAQVTSDTTIANGASPVIFHAGDLITGEFRVDTSVPNTSTWGFANENAVYQGSLTGFSFFGDGLSVIGNGAGVTSVSNNRRLTSSPSSARTDEFSGASGSGMTFAATTIGGGVGSIQYDMQTPFLAAGSPPTAITSIALPTVLNSSQLAQFTQEDYFQVNFANSSTLRATPVSFNITTVDSGSVVPEPETYATVAAVSLCGFAIWRRRQAKV